MFFQFKKQFVCTACEHVVIPVRAKKGSLMIEIILWLFFLFPGLIYSIWRYTSRHRICPKCKSLMLVPIDSPRGKKLLLKNGQINMSKPKKRKAWEYWVMAIFMLFFAGNIYNINVNHVRLKFAY